MISTKNTIHTRWFEQYPSTVTEYELAGAYVAGVIDAGSSISVDVGKSSKSRLGYTISPRISINRTDPTLINVVDSWARDHGIQPRINERKNYTELIIEKRDDLIEFLELISPYIIVHENEVQLILNELIPRLEDGDHTAKEGFVETMGYVDMVRDSTKSTDHKYDQQYFKELWAEEISGTSQ